MSELKIFLQPQDCEEVFTLVLTMDVFRSMGAYSNAAQMVNLLQQLLPVPFNSYCEYAKLKQALESLRRGQSPESIKLECCEYKQDAASLPQGNVNAPGDLRKTQQELSQCRAEKIKIKKELEDLQKKYLAIEGLQQKLLEQTNALATERDKVKDRDAQLDDAHKSLIKSEADAKDLRGQVKILGKKVEDLEKQLKGSEGDGPKPPGKTRRTPLDA